MTQQHRHYLYGIVQAAIPILVALGLIVGDQAGLWIVLAGAVLGIPATDLARRWSADDVQVKRGRHAASSVDE